MVAYRLEFSCGVGGDIFARDTPLEDPALGDVEHTVNLSDQATACSDRYFTRDSHSAFDSAIDVGRGRDDVGEDERLLADRNASADVDAPLESTLK
jgi:hypothetical protein